ncbi:hypothetical protein KC19_VG012900 [Ceratodon purpureus]|uniref:Uncharacterized protein n=1 Tax=Ceratodon purpureus TaxID=3225 RepID=A0A8T0HL71_CERPU|nr:hypothetical protein KC19_VG012900 [Ceratodon purpureus]
MTRDQCQFRQTKGDIKLPKKNLPHSLTSGQNSGQCSNVVEAEKESTWADYGKMIGTLQGKHTPEEEKSNRLLLLSPLDSDILLADILDTYLSIEFALPQLIPCQRLDC